MFQPDNLRHRPKESQYGKVSQCAAESHFCSLIRQRFPVFDIAVAGFRQASARRCAISAFRFFGAHVMCVNAVPMIRL